MKEYIHSLKETGTIKLVAIIVLTIARIYYGWSWLSSGIGKLAWLSDGKLNSAGYIGRMVENMATDYGDPFKLGRIMSVIADKVFLNLPGLTDFLVVFFEFVIGIMLIIGLKLFWAILLAMFLNLQFFAAGSTNNFGYVITNLVIWRWTKLFDAIGVDGFLRHKKGDDLL